MNTHVEADADEALEDVEERVLTFPDGIPGFSGARHFLLADLNEQGTFQLLQCLDDPGLSLVVCVPWMFFPDYAPEISEADEEDLGLERPEDAVVFCTVTADDDEDEVLYLNLLGPFVVNSETLVGRQVVLSDLSLPTRAAVRLGG